MTTVPPSGTPPPQLPAGPAAAPAVRILNPPPAVAVLPPGTILEGVVKPAPETPESAPETAKPTAVLRTALGDVTVRVPTPLPDNARVALEVLRAAGASPAPQNQSQTPDTAVSAPQVTVRLVAINDQPAVQVLAQLVRQAADARGAATPAPQQGAIPANDPQNPLLRVAILPQGTAWTPNGALQLPSLGTISALVVMGDPVAASAENSVSAAQTTVNTPAAASSPTTNAPNIQAVPA